MIYKTLFMAKIPTFSKCGNHFSSFSSAYYTNDIHYVFVGSPFIQEIEELSPSVTGAGLKRGREGHKSVFKVDARGFPGELSVYVDGNCFNISLHK